MIAEAEVDVLLPVRNAEVTLPEALDSIVRQTFSRFRVVAVDDGSTDRSAATLARYAARDPRFTVVSGPGAGLVAALNRGLEYSSAPLIARLDADDVMLPERLERQVAYMRTHPDIDVLGCGVQTDGLRPGFRHYVAWNNALLTPQALRRARFVESPMIHPTVVFRRTLCNKYGAYREGDFPEDYELWLRWMDHGAVFAKLPELLMIWRDSPGRLTRVDPRYRVEAFFAVKARYLSDQLIRWGVQQVWVWGAGPRTRRRVRALTRHGICIAGFIDIDPRKIGGCTPDGLVFGPDDLPNPEQAFVLAAVGTRGAREQIASALEIKGFIEGRSYLAIA